MIDSHSFGSVKSTEPEGDVLTGSFTPPSTGLYLLEIENTRTLNSESDLRNYIDNILVVPENYMLGADGQTFSALFGTTLSMDLTAGPTMADRDYWIWIGYSGTYPGIPISGLNIPLNYDPIVALGLNTPGLGLPGFVGKLDDQGEAVANLYWKPDAAMAGFTLYFAYVVLSPGGGLPVLAASNPINATATPFY